VIIVYRKSHATAVRLLCILCAVHHKQRALCHTHAVLMALNAVLLHLCAACARLVDLFGYFLKMAIYY
jgi:hypothetical protein